jgi:hypothetical protein
MAELANLPRCSVAELRVGFATAATARYDSPLPRGDAQKDALNGNFAALGDNWALRRHVIIPASAAEAGALVKLLEFMDSAGEREDGRERDGRARRTFLLSDGAYGPLPPLESASRSRFNPSKTDDRCPRSSDRVGGMAARVFSLAPFPRY